AARAADHCSNLRYAGRRCDADRSFVVGIVCFVLVRELLQHGIVYVQFALGFHSLDLHLLFVELVVGGLDRRFGAIYRLVHGLRYGEPPDRADHEYRRDDLEIVLHRITAFERAYLVTPASKHTISDLTGNRATGAGRADRSLLHSPRN